MKRLLVLLVACTDVHHVTLQIGPTDATLSSGFTCDDPMNAGHLLFERALDPNTGALDFSMLVDFIDLGDKFPSCLAEEVIAACSDASCHVSVADAPTRFCQPVHIARADLVPDAETAIRSYLSTNFSTITTEAPHRAVLVRAVATLEDCAALTTATTTDWPAPTRKDVLGCAYSCPVDLDDLNGTVELGLNIDIRNATAQQCVTAIDGCAVFPN